MRLYCLEKGRTSLVSHIVEKLKDKDPQASAQFAEASRQAEMMALVNIKGCAEESANALELARKHIVKLNKHVLSRHEEWEGTERMEDLLDENLELYKENEQLDEKNEKLEEETKQLDDKNERLEYENERLQDENERMREILERCHKHNRTMKAYIKGARAENRLLKVEPERSAATMGGTSTVEKQATGSSITIAKVQSDGVSKAKYHLRTRKNI